MIRKGKNGTILRDPIRGVRVKGECDVQKNMIEILYTHV
jgi:hypothetical protein